MPEKIRTKSRRTPFRRIFKPAWLYLLSRSLEPLSPTFGSNRGEPVDRYYIDKFLLENSDFIHGNCLEIEDNIYTLKFGKNITRSDILDFDARNSRANYHADLRNMPEIKDAAYDCIILTQVLSFIDDYDAAIKECRRILKPNGVILATLSIMGRIDGRAKQEGDYWNFKPASARYIFGKHFENENLEIKSCGNVLSGLGYWIGMAQEELTKIELDHIDPRFPIMVTVRARK